jgi:hypothetical protein
VRSTKTLIACVATVLVACGLATAAGVSATGTSKFTATPLSPTSSYTGFKSMTGQLAQTDPSLLNRTDSTPVNVMIKYDLDGTASYAGGVAGLAPTSPLVTGKSLDDNKAAVAAYDKHANKVVDQISGAVQSAVPSTKIGQTFTTAYGGVSARVPANTIDDLLKVDGVAAVQKDALNQPLDDNTDFIGAKAVWPSLGGSSTAGSNVIVGVIDTGIWPENPMLSPAGIAAPTTGNPPWGCQFGDGSDVTHLGQPFACNHKLIGAYAFTDTYLSVVGATPGEFCNQAAGICSARDSEGHGTHTMTTAAGDCVSSAVLYGTDRGPVCGIAPGAHVIEYRVCLAQGCFASDSVAAVGQAIQDGVNVLNFSISGGGNAYTDPVELAFLDAFDAGISVNAAAGNAGPGAGTSDHGGPWVTTVGASTGPRFFTSTLHLTADGGATFNATGYTITNGITTPTPVVLAQNLPGEDNICGKQLATGTATGKVVLCQRGGSEGGAAVARIDKGYNVSQGGAAGMILYNPIAQDVETDNHWLPTIHVNGPPDALLAFVGSHTNVKAAWATGVASPTTPDVMATFSSRGPVGDFIKPDVTAPGIQVLAGMTPQPDPTITSTGAPSPNGPPGNNFQAIAGTSMSSPHAAGVSALVKAAHPDWDPAEIKSALMTSSVQDVVKEDGTTPADPFDDGAGSIRADRAVNPTIVFDENTADYVASATDPLHRIDLNIPSIDATTMTGTITTSRTAINVSGKPQNMSVETDAPAGVSIVVSANPPGDSGPKAANSLVFEKKGTTTFWVTISAPSVPDGQYFGRITLDPHKLGANSVTIPVAFFKQQGAVSLTHTCSPTTVGKTQPSHCAVTMANSGSLPAHATLTVTGDNGLDYSNVSPPATAIRNNNGVTWSGTLTPALAPTIDSLTNITGNGPAGGYLPLSFFPGIPAISGTDDDTVTNFNVPTFYYGSEPYSTVGVGSNGTLIVGGGTAADATPFPQTFPNPARPNNVIAPFWTDLNPGAGGNIRIGLLSDSVSGQAWIVVDWEAVKNFSNANTHTGEIWLRVATGSAGAGPSSEQTTISYGAANSTNGDPGTGINWGAENRDGSSGKSIPAPGPADGSEYSVDTSPPQTGGTQTITYDASSKKAGTYTTTAAMTSDVTPGTTQVPQTITVTK